MITHRTALHPWYSPGQLINNLGKISFCFSQIRLRELCRQAARYQQQGALYHQSVLAKPSESVPVREPAFIHPKSCIPKNPASGCNGDGG